MILVLSDPAGWHKPISLRTEQLLSCPILSGWLLFSSMLAAPFLCCSSKIHQFALDVLKEKQEQVEIRHVCLKIQDSAPGVTD